MDRKWLRRSFGTTLCAALALASMVVPMAVAEAKPLPPARGDYERWADNLCPRGDLRCVDDTLRIMRRHVDDLVGDCDHDAVFALLYLIVTQTYRDTVADDGDFFGDTAFVNREDAVFAGYYFGAYANWHARGGDRDVVPPAWRIAFRAAERQQVNGVGSLLLGVSAHVTRDLPFALAGLGLGDKDDHDRVNDILFEAYPHAIKAIDERLDDSIDSTDIRGTRFDNDLLFELVTTWREEAWRNAQLLAAAETPVARAAVARKIEEEARTQAVSIRRLTAYPPVGDDREERNDYCARQAAD